jgi:hypothetical protein
MYWSVFGALVILFRCADATSLIEAVSLEDPAVTTHLDLSRRSLTGTVPTTLGLLTGLTHLDLSGAAVSWQMYVILDL